jgi:regulator of cell morphogenesis and NO signaling
MNSITISADRTVNQIIQANPETVSVFARYNIDSCCGGNLPLQEVADRHGLDLSALLAELNSVEPEYPACGR